MTIYIMTLGQLTQQEVKKLSIVTYRNIFNHLRSEVHPCIPLNNLMVILWPSYDILIVILTMIFHIHLHNDTWSNGTRHNGILHNNKKYNTVPKRY
jgi:hypothetical protein